MTTKSNILKSAFIAASISAGIAVAYAFQPAKTADELKAIYAEVKSNKGLVALITARKKELENG